MSPAVVTNDGNGNYSGRMASLRLGRYAVYAKLMGEDVMTSGNDTSDVVVIPGAMHALQSGPEMAGSVSVTAGIAAVVNITVRDIFGNPTWYREEESVISVVVSHAVANGSDVTVVDRNETVFVSYIATLAGIYDLNVKLNGLPLRGSPYSVTVRPGAVEPSTALATGVGLSATTAGETQLIYVVMRDAFGNRLGADPFRNDPLVRYTIFDTDAPLPENVTVNVANATTNETAVFVGTVSAREPAAHGSIVGFVESLGFRMQAYTLTRTANYAISLTVGSFSVVNSRPLMFAPAPANARFSSVERVTASQTVLAGAFIDYAVTLRDAFNNTIHNLSSQPGPHPIVSLRVFAQRQQRDNTPMLFSPTISLPPPPGATVLLRTSSKVAGDVIITALLHGDFNSLPEVIGTPNAVTVVALPTADLTRSMAEGPGLVGGAVGEQLTVLVSLNDVYGNRVTDTESDPGLRLTFDNGYASPLEFVGVRQVVALSSFVRYAVNYTISQAGGGVVRLIIGGAAVTFGGAAVTLGPYPVTIEPNITGPLDPLSSFAYGPGTASAVAGVRGSFAIQAVSLKGLFFASPSSFHNLFAAWIAPRLTALPPLTLSINPTATGLAADYTLTRSGLYHLHVTYNQTDVSGSPYNLAIAPASASPSASAAFGAQLTLATAGLIASFRIQARDRWSNPLTDDSYYDGSLKSILVTVSRIPSSASPLVILTPPDADAPAYIASLRASFTAPAAGTYTVQTTILQFNLPPASLTIHPGPLNPRNSIAIGAGLSLSTAGVPAEFRLSASDSFSTRKNLVNDPLLFISLPTYNCTTFQRAAVPGDAQSVAVSYTITAAGTYPLIASLAGVHFSGSPFIIRVTVGPVSISVNLALHNDLHTPARFSTPDPVNYRLRPG